MFFSVFQLSELRASSASLDCDWQIVIEKDRFVVSVSLRVAELKLNASVAFALFKTVFYEPQ